VNDKDQNLGPPIIDIDNIQCNIDRIMGSISSANNAKEIEISHDNAFKISDLLSDYQKVRQTRGNAIEQYTEIINILIAELKETPNSKLAIVIKELLESMGDESEKLLKSTRILAEIKENIDKANRGVDDLAQPGQQINVDKAIFVGNIDEILKMRPAEVRSLKSGEIVGD